MYAEFKCVLQVRVVCCVDTRTVHELRRKSTIGRTTSGAPFTSATCTFSPPELAPASCSFSASALVPCPCARPATTDIRLSALVNAYRWKIFSGAQSARLVRGITASPVATHISNNRN